MERFLAREYLYMSAAGAVQFVCFGTSHGADCTELSDFGCLDRLRGNDNVFVFSCMPGGDVHVETRDGLQQAGK